MVDRDENQTRHADDITPKPTADTPGLMPSIAGVTEAATPVIPFDEMYEAGQIQGAKTEGGVL